MCSVCEVGAAIAIVRVVALKAKVGLIIWRSVLLLLLLLLTLLGRGRNGPKCRLHGGEHYGNSNSTELSRWNPGSLILTDQRGRGFQSKLCVI